MAALLNAHTVGAHTSSQPARQQRQPPKVDRPQLSDAIDEERKNAFNRVYAVWKVRENSIKIRKGLESQGKSGKVRDFEEKMCLVRESQGK